MADAADQGAAILLPVDEARMPRPAGIYEHWCQHPGCGAWGGWGFAHGKATIWYCGEHRDDAEKLMRPRNTTGLANTGAPNEWAYHGDAKRLALLQSSVSFEEIVARIVDRAVIAQRPKIWKFLDGATEREREARQIVFRIKLDPLNLCDLFFNGRDGLRARYWRDSALGDQATQTLIAALLPRLLEVSVDAAADYGEHPMSLNDVGTALERGSAKVWPTEDGREPRGCLFVNRWQDHPHPRFRDMWRWTPETNDLEIKSALIDLLGREHIPEKKKDRAGQIFWHGFS